MKLIKNLFKSKNDLEVVNTNPFNMLMDIANRIAIENPHALRDLVYAILRPLQSEHILSVAERNDHEARAAIDGDSFFFRNFDIFSGTKYLLRDKPKFELNLACDPILPSPWVRNDFANALSTIGTGRKQGAWEQNTNHVVSLWLPWGIGFVSGGNHSISSGILSGEKILIEPCEVLDFSPLLEHVICNGASYQEKQNGEILAEVTDHRRAAIFEIGRLMIQHNVIPLPVKS